MVKRPGVLFLVAPASFGEFVVPAQNGGGQIIRLDPALDALISPDARIEKLADGFGFTEGPVWVRSGGLPYLVFSDIPANAIGFKEAALKTRNLRNLPPCIPKF
jgi:hypothetical protein